MTDANSKKSNKKGIVTGLLRGPSFKYTKTYWLDIPSQLNDLCHHSQEKVM